jgi:TonB family protein
MAEERYIQERRKQANASRATGVVLTVSIHAALIVCFFVSGFTYLDPPPPEQQQIVIDFQEYEVQKPKQVWNGTQPRAEEASKEIKLVQQSEAQHVGAKANEAPEATVGDQGDVEVPEPPREKPIDRRALFSAANNKTEKDTLAAQTARKVSDALKEGHAMGNTKTGETQGEPKARLAGRTLNGTIPSPRANYNKSGTVVVDIWVDNYGTVVKAVAGAEGTNITDAHLLVAARNAAMGASFNMSADAPAMQHGTITYIFKITK